MSIITGQAREIEELKTKLAELQKEYDLAEKDRKSSLEILSQYVQAESNGDLISSEEVQELREKLARYEQAEKEGRMIMPPVAIGQKVYHVISTRDGSHSFYNEVTVVGLHIRDDENRRCTKHGEYMIVRCNGYAENIRMKEVGKTVFLSREEAENALKERENRG